MKHPLRCRALLATLLLASVASLAAPYAASAPQAADDGSGRSRAELQAERAAIARAIEVRALGARRALGTLDRSHYEVAVAAHQFEGDPDVTRAWVADGTRWLPYRGVLRGAEGVLLDRHGSHLDRALLLAAMLRAQGKNVQLARADLDDAAARQIVAAAAAMPPLAPPPADAPTDRELDSIASALGQEPGAYRAARAAAAVRRSTAFEDALSTCLPIALELGALLAEAPDPTATAEESRLTAASDLWWVRSRATREDPWIDHHLWTLAVSPTPVEIVALDAVPAERKHRLEVRVELERRSEGKLETVSLLTETLVPAELRGAAVSLSVQCMDPPPRQRPGEEASAFGKRSLLAAEYWMPLLRVGKDLIGQSAFRLDGSVDSEAVKNVTVRKLDAVTGTIASLGAPAADPAKDDALVAVRAVFTILAPGAAERRFERTIYDALTPSERSALPALPARQLSPDGESARLGRALALSRRTDLAAWGFRPRREWLEARTLATIIANAPGESALATALPGGDQPAIVKQFSERRPDDSHLWAVVDARTAWNPRAAALAAQELQLLAFHTERRAADSGQTADVRLRFDWMANTLAPLSFDDGAGRDLRVLQGVIDTYAEAAILELFGEPRNNAARDHELAAAAGRAPTVVRDAADAALDRLGVRAAGWRAAVASGATLALIAGPDGAPTTAWRIDPLTGDTLGLDLDGHGNAFTDYCMNVYIRAEMWIAENKTLALVVCVACKAGAQLTNLVPAELETITCGAWCLMAGAGT